MRRGTFSASAEMLHILSLCPHPWGLGQAPPSPGVCHCPTRAGVTPRVEVLPLPQLG